MTAQQWEGISLPLTKMDRQIAYGMEIYNGYSGFFFLIYSLFVKLYMYLSMGPLFIALPSSSSPFCIFHDGKIKE